MVELKEVKISDVKVDQPTTLDVKSSVTQVAEAIAKDPNHMVIITENKVPKGVVTDTDIITWIKAATGNVDPTKVKAGDLNPKPIIKIVNTSNLDEAIGVFTTTGFNKLLVIDVDGTLKGVLTRMRAIDAMRRQQLQAL